MSDIQQVLNLILEIETNFLNYDFESVESKISELSKFNIITDDLLIKIQDKLQENLNVDLKIQMQKVDDHIYFRNYNYADKELKIISRRIDKCEYLMRKLLINYEISSLKSLVKQVVKNGIFAIERKEELSMLMELKKEFENETKYNEYLRRYQGIRELKNFLDDNFK